MCFFCALSVETWCSGALKIETQKLIWYFVIGDRVRVDIRTESINSDDALNGVKWKKYGMKSLNPLSWLCTNLQTPDDSLATSTSVTRLVSAQHMRLA